MMKSGRRPRSPVWLLEIWFSVHGRHFAPGAPAGERSPNVFIGSERNAPDRISILSSVLYHRPTMSGQSLQLGVGDVENQSVTIEGNRILGGTQALSMRNWRQARVVGNTIRAFQNDDKRFLVDVYASSVAMRGTDGTGYGYTWNRNNYLDVSEREAPTSFRLANGTDREALTFGRWRERTSLDAGSTYQNIDPKGAEVIVRADRYEPGRAIVTVINWDGRSSIRIDPAVAGMRPLTRFEVRDIQNIFGDPVASGVWSGGPIEVPLRVHRQSSRSVRATCVSSTRCPTSGPSSCCHWLRPTSLRASHSRFRRAS